MAIRTIHQLDCSTGKVRVFEADIPEAGTPAITKNELDQIKDTLKAKGIL